MVLRVTDTGVGVRGGREGLGTGLDALRDRLRMAHGDDATVTLAPHVPRGTVATVSYRAPAAASDRPEEPAP